MPLIYGSFLAGALLSCALPIGLVIAFVSFFHHQASRQRSLPESAPKVADPPVNPGQPSSNH